MAGWLPLLAVLLPKVSSHGVRNTEWVKPPPPAGVTAHDFPYVVNGENYTGYVAYPSNASDVMPGVLIAHQWYGLGEMEQFRTEEMAGRGFVGFALDVYGTGVRPTNDEEAEAEMTELTSDPIELRMRVQAGLDQLQNLGEGPEVNRSACVANGYCFGGLMVLELARTGGDAVKAVSSFHGELGNLTSQSDDDIRCVVQVHHGQDDYQGDSVLRDFEAEMTDQNVEHWSTLYYSHMQHGWTDPSQDVYRHLEAESAHAAMRGLYDLLV